MRNNNRLFRRILACGIVLLFIVLSVTSIISGYQSMNDDDYIVAYWEFDEGSGIFGTVQSEQNNIIISKSNLSEETCDCEAFMRTDDPNSYGYFVMDEPLYIDDSYVLSSSKPSIVSTPDEFSWKNFEGKDWTTPAKSQGNCGSCWDFAAIGTLESIIKIREENPDLSIDLSEQYVLSCLPDAANNYGQGCLGGTPYGAFYYMMDTSAEGNYENGAIPESCFSYQASHNIPCSEKCENWEDLLIPILDCSESYLGFDSPENRAIIKSLIYQNGPIAGAMNATQDFINFWNTHHDPTDYYPDPHAPWGNRLNHIIVIVGWKNDSSITNGGYWICKNSWGTSWGYQGFYNIEYGALFTGYYISTVDYDPESNNLPPTIPTINGSNEGTPGNEYIYTLTSEDPDDDEICYFVDWGDDTSSGWSDFVESGTPVTVSHTWAEKDTYTIAAKAKDEYSLESDWATLEVVMPVNQQVINPLIQMILERFPNAFPILAGFNERFLPKYSEKPEVAPELQKEESKDEISVTAPETPVKELLKEEKSAEREKPEKTEEPDEQEDTKEEIPLDLTLKLNDMYKEGDQIPVTATLTNIGDEIITVSEMNFKTGTLDFYINTPDGYKLHFIYPTYDSEMRYWELKPEESRDIDMDITRGLFCISPSPSTSDCPYNFKEGYYTIEGYYKSYYVETTTEVYCNIDVWEGELDSPAYEFTIVE